MYKSSMCQQSDNTAYKRKRERVSEREREVMVYGDNL